MAIDFLELQMGDVPNALFPTDNEYGIPLLDMGQQAKFLDMPVTRWGEISRKSRMQGTYHFYIQDFKFEALWKNPTPIVNSRCINVIEPNFSTSLSQPKAVAIWNMYRKRWLSRYWQEHGINIIVDLNVSENYLDLAFVGVPMGWGAYAIRADSDDVDFVINTLDKAKSHADGNKTLLVVYGGGKNYRQLCYDNGWVWIPNANHVADGRFDDG